MSQYIQASDTPKEAPEKEDWEIEADRWDLIDIEAKEDLEQDEDLYDLE